MSAHPVISEEDLHAYVDGRLDPDRRAAVEAYLRETPDAAARVAEDIAQRHALRAALGPIAAEPLPPSLNLSRLVEERLARRRFPWLATAAAILALLVGGGGGWLLKPRPTGLQALVQEAGASYAVFVPDVNRPVELWADQKALLTRWISRRLDRPVAPPDLSTLGYHLLGGRLLASPRGPAALFVYENDRKTRLTLYVRPMKAGPSTTPIRQVDARSGDGCAWIEHGIGYMVMAAEPYDELLRLSDEVRKQTRAT